MPTKTFQNDINIMEVIMIWDISDDTKYKINICRLKKKVYFLGDLLDPSGTKLKTDALSLKEGLHPDKFPQITLPNTFQELWQSTIRRLLDSSPLSSLGTIQNYHSFPWLISTSQDILIHRTNHRTALHFRSHHQQYSILPSSLTIPIVPKTVASVKIEQDYIKVQHKYHIEYHENPSRPIPYTTQPEIEIASSALQQRFLQQLDLLPQALRRNIGSLQPLDYLSIIGYYLKHSQVVGIGDASVNNGRSCHAYIIESKNESYNICGAAPVDTLPEDATSNRAEMCTILALITLLIEIAKLFNITSSSAYIYCDNSEAIRQTPLDQQTYYKYTKRDVDLRLSIQELLKNSPINIQFVKVAGHQDNKSDFNYHEASQEVRRNIDMDTSAKRFLKSPPKVYQPVSQSLFFPHQIAQLNINGIPIHGPLRESVNRPRKSFGIPARYLQMIEWESFGIAFKKLNQQDQISRENCASTPPDVFHSAQQK